MRKIEKNAVYIGNYIGKRALLANVE